MQENQTAALVWLDDQPYSSHYDDVYFSTDNGIAETNYVFLQGNQLHSRWQTLDQQRFTIYETGFGTGLNFCAAAKLWQSSINKQSCTLHFISVEKHPLQAAEIAKALAHWPSLKPFSDRLLEVYSTIDLNHTGALNMRITPNIELTLCLGDAVSQLAQCDLLADAWFLDGFSPAKNPEMWQTALFERMAALSKSGTSFSTFTSAGIVKRGLIAAGFTVQKQAGYGKKREMLIGYLNKNKACDDLNHARA